MLKCEELMQEELLALSKNKIYRIGNYTDLSKNVSFSFIKHLNKTLKETDTFIQCVKQDYVLLYTILVKRELRKEKIVDFAISIDINEEDNTYQVTDCYVTAWLNKKED